MRLDEAETAVARAVALQHFPKVARNVLRNEVGRALVEMQSEDLEEKESLGIRLRKIEGPDEPLIELAAEGTIATIRLRQGLESVTLLKGAIHEVRGAVVAEAAGKPPADLKDTKRTHLRVNGRAGEACPVCGETVREVSFADSALQYCPTCQTKGKILADRRTSRF